MNITDVLSSPWAIMPEKLEAIHAVVSAHLRGDSIDVTAIEAKLGRQLANPEQGYQVINGVAVVPINGVMGKKMNMMSAISGGASTQMIARDIGAALQDNSVNSILLHVESPGGTVDGVQSLAALIKTASTQKPMMAFADGLMASAAYWVGSAAGEIVAAESATQIGSIGVVVTHKDMSKANDAQGVTVTEISAGKYKRMASNNAPLSDDGRALIQDQVDQMYTIFVDAVAENRGVDTETVLEDMADGRVFLAKQAKKRGMIDQIASFEQTIFNMSTGVWPMSKVTTPQADVPVAATPVMDIAALKKEYPEICAALIAEGATAECARIQGCEEYAMEGHEAILTAMKYDGKSTAADVAMAIIGAEKATRGTKLADFTSNAPNVIAMTPSPVLDKPVATDMSQPLDVRAKAEWDADASLRSSYADDFSLFMGYMKANEAGSVKILGK